jgi:hypothetical protein
MRLPLRRNSQVEPDLFDRLAGDGLVKSYETGYELEEICLSLLLRTGLDFQRVEPGEKGGWSSAPPFGRIESPALKNASVNPVALLGARGSSLHALEPERLALD